MEKQKPSIILAVLLFFLLAAVGWVLIGEIACSDGWASPSIGKSGACSYHGGIRLWPWRVVLILSFIAAVLFHFKRLEIYERDIAKNKRQNFRLESKSEPKEENKSDIKEDAKETRDDANKVKTKNSSPRCPVCRSGMILRTAKKGRRVGKQFWGCGRYPRCRGTSSYKEEKSDICAKCGASSVVDILYGFPDDSAFREVEAGRLVLGGCFELDKAPKRRCTACGLDIFD